MTLKIQIITMFFLGAISWNGIDDAITNAKRMASAEVLMQLSLKQLTEMRIS